MKSDKRFATTGRFSGFMLGLLLLGGLAACSNDDDNGSDTPKPTPYPTTTFSKIELTEVMKSDAQPVTSTQTYLYNSKGRLTDYTGQQTIHVNNETVKIENATTVAYSDRQAVITDDAGNVFTYALNDRGYAVACTCLEGGGNILNYTFDYLVNTENKYYLTNITETKADGTVYSSIDIDYTSYRSLRIIQRVDANHQTYTVQTDTDNEVTNTSEIPILFLTEMYPLSLHHAAIYGKLLGEPFQTLITQIIPEGNEKSNETTTYTYTLNSNGFVTSCHAVTNSYGENYTRTVSYNIQ